jgi:NADH:ubiquinone oxidoreductase subunit 6 (subunit J)
LDLVLTIVFYTFAILAVVGALVAALAPTASLRLMGLIGVAVGTAGVMISLSAWLVALISLVCLGASAFLVAGGREVRAASPTPSAWFREAGFGTQAGVVAAALLLVLLALVAAGGSFSRGGSGTAGIGVASLGRILFARDALAVEAAGAAAMIAMAMAAAVRGGRP